MKRVLVSADDFGLSSVVNEAIERAHREGILTSASLMMGAPATEDAVRRARSLPSLRVGLHLVVVEGTPVLPPAKIPALVDEHGKFPSDQFRLGLRYFFCPHIRRQLQAEIHAQFSAFAATGLTLDHANAHKHMHLHPTVGTIMIDVGRDFGLRALRVPAEPPRVIADCGATVTLSQRLLYRWTMLLRRQARRANLHVNDHCFGLAWSGQMTAEQLLTLIPRLPDGVTEIYFHPAARRDPALDALMPDYAHEEEMAALLDPRVRKALASCELLQGYTALG